jgi:hypothetical protein
MLHSAYELKPYFSLARGKKSILSTFSVDFYRIFTHLLPIFTNLLPRFLPIFATLMSNDKEVH